MPIDGLFLKKISQELSFLKGGKINKIQEISNTDYIFNIRANYKNYNLLTSLSNEYARIHLTDKTYEYPSSPKSLTMLLRKHFEGAIIKDIYTYKMDRVFIIEAQGLNEIGDLENKKIVFEIMSRFSNMIILKGDVIIDALKKQNSIDSDRIIFPNAKFNYLNDNKIDPYNLSLDEINEIFNKKNIITPKELTNIFMGISLQTANYIFSTKTPYITFFDIINSSYKPMSFTFKNKTDFYFTYIGNNALKEYENLSLMLDDIYYDKALKERIKQKTNDLSLFVSKQIFKLDTKLTKLNLDLEEAMNNDKYKLYGELLIANSYINKKSNEITVINYYDSKEITIPLDIRYNIIDNSKIYFKKYQKSKNAINHIKEQIVKTQDEIEYFALIKSQIQNATLSDILEIQEELNSLKYIDIKKKKERKTKSKILTYILDDDTKIYVGKNNIQNEIITHKLSLPNEMWFHVKDAPGSHVLIKKQTELSEYEIRTCALIAAYYSSYKDSSSVPVNYTKIRYIKKIPGKRNCFVTFTNEKTIYIDPSKDIIDSLKQTITNI